MFYENQPLNQRENYKRMLSIIGNLTQLFSESDCPYLPYRAHENIFCKYFEADNLARMDCSADAKKNRIGIGLKTWMGQDDQKVAEFGRLRETFAGLTGLDLVRRIAEYRNERIRVTKNLNGIDTMIYHIVKRVPGAMQVLEHAFEYIDIDNLSLIPNRGNVNNTYFTDGHHTYHFSVSKNTLYMIFEDMELLDTFDVEIMDDPYNFLMTLTVKNRSMSQKKYCVLHRRLGFRKFVCDCILQSQTALNLWLKKAVLTNGTRREDRAIRMSYTFRILPKTEHGRLDFSLDAIQYLI